MVPEFGTFPGNGRLGWTYFPLLAHDLCFSI
jgi:hypothetical protein